MEDLYRDSSLQSRMDTDGILTLPLLTAEEVRAIRAFYDDLHPDGVPPQMRDGIHMTIWCSDYAYKVRVRETLLDILRPACERHFQDFRIVSPVFIVKRKGADTTFPIHQDWNVVDEERHRAFNVWIPLHPVDAQNGSLWHVPGSHRLPTVVRGPGLLFPNLYDIQAHVAPRMRSLSLDAGDAMVFYHRIIHGSPPNQSETPRVVVAFSLLPKDVPLHIYFQEGPEAPLQVYHPSDDFIYQFENVRDDTPKVPPIGQLVEERAAYRPVKLTPQVFDQYCPVVAPTFWSRFKKALRV